MSKLPFTEEDVNAAADNWGCNCGPAAICGVLSMTPEQLRPHLLDFEQKRYTNPTLMFDVLKSLNVPYRVTYKGDDENPRVPYPALGLVRIQFGGPWTKPNVPMAARYRETHWAGVRFHEGGLQAFDVNAMCVGGWLSWAEWSKELIPWLISEAVPKGSGAWWPTHIIKIEEVPN